MNKPLVILNVGDPNTGKTVNSCTFPKDLLLIDFDDGGFKSIENAKDKDGQLVVKEQDKIKIETIRKTKTYQLNFKTQLKGKVAPAHVAEAGMMMDRFNGLLMNIKEGEYRTVVIDSLTSMFRIWKEAILHYNSQAALQIQDYMTLENILYGQFIPTVKALPVDYVILIDHTNIDKDEISGRVSEFPVGPSANMGRTMPQSFDEVWRSEATGQDYIWRTKKAGLFVGAGSRLDLPDPIKPATYQRLKELIPTLK